MKLYSSKKLGFPVLIKVQEEYALIPEYMLALPHHSFFGAKTYFDDGDTILTNSCGIIEYDFKTIEPVKSRHTSFIVPTKEQIEECLKNPKCTDFFRDLVIETIKEIEEKKNKVKKLIFIEGSLDHLVTYEPKNKECIKSMKKISNDLKESLSENELMYYKTTKNYYYDF